ncbi:3D domain-containing protein [Fontivita pretiosa]|jgi:3D (Asp-Asp-Asp) domain-containing protein|uniref:3D domain-containing protein n=1 Tax=Fontivita pretiosa TaxID=2989684 RepID=UPI003D1841CD
MLMFNGLLSNLLVPVVGNLPSCARRGLLIGIVLLVIGIGGVGAARPVQSKSAPANSASQSASVRQAESVASHSLKQGQDLVELMAPQLPPLERMVRQPQVRFMEITAYCPCSKCCGPNAQGITASGKHVSYNHGKFVAADTSILPFGTRLLIPGYAAEPVEVIDRGGAIKGNKLDVFFPTHEEALKWGRQKMVPVIIVE